MGYSVAESNQSTMQLVIDQLEELIVTVIEEVRARPAVAVAILAGVVGALVGSALARGTVRKRKPVAKRVTKKATKRVAKSAKGVSNGVGTMGDIAELAGKGMRLLENPLVRAAIVGQLRKRVVR